MKILKRNQIIILVIALMLVSAGYLNYISIQTKNTVQTSADEYMNIELEYAAIGDARLVSSNGIVENENQEVVVSDEEKQNEEIKETSSKVLDSSIKEYFTTSRLNRETMYSEMIETYEKILENESISEAQKTIAQTEIKNINEIKNKIMICENLIKTKNIEDVVIFVNDESISVIVKKDKLEQEQIAQIQNIIAREMLVDISNIHISNK